MFRTKRFVLLAVLLIAASGIVIFRGMIRSSPSPGTVSESSVVTAENAPKIRETIPTDSEVSAVATEPDAAVPYIAQSRYQQIRERMEILQKSCPDFIGWLYVADSEMDLPVVQGSDNDFYLTHAPDGSYIQEGTIFLDCRSSPDLSDLHNVLYGHNMVSGMFGDIRSYKEREEFDKHRYGWFFTPEKTYRIEFFALSIVSTNDLVYETGADHSQWLDCILEKAMYTADPLPEESDRLISLSTCASEFASARALFTGRLVPVENEEDIISQIN